MINSTISCSIFSQRNSFDSYISEVLKYTGSDEGLLSACKAEICNALWGSGNSDISGVGVSKK